MLDVELDKNTTLLPVRENDIERRLAQLRIEARGAPQIQPIVKLKEDTEVKRACIQLSKSKWQMNNFDTS
jgi:hypothetical protein